MEGRVAAVGHGRLEGAASLKVVRQGEELVMSRTHRPLHRVDARPTPSSRGESGWT